MLDIFSASHKHGQPEIQQSRVAGKHRSVDVNGLFCATEHERFCMGYNYLIWEIRYFN